MAFMSEQRVVMGEVAKVALCPHPLCNIFH